MKILKLVFLILPILIPSFAAADSTMRMIRKLEGYTIISVTSVDGEFKGCEYGKIIKLQDGSAYKCNSYGYSYAYSPDVIVFAKTRSFQGTMTIATIKLIIDTDIYEMEPVLIK